MLTGSVTVQPDDFTTLTPAPIKVTLKRRVARFDISNIAATTGITIKQIRVSNAHWTAYIFSNKSALPAFEFAGVANANTGVSKSVFYLYPSDVVSIQLFAAGVGGTERLYNITLPEGGIQANKSYTIKASTTNASTFELAIDDWESYGDAVVSSANPIKIVSSSAIGYSAGWNGATLRYDVSASNTITTITLNVSTLTSKGVSVEVKDAPLDYTITATTDAPTLTGTTELSYTQTVTITVPKYELGAALEAKVLIKDAYDNTQCKTVVITREDYYPTPHKGWAGSNIYWNGSKLTFDDVGVTTHEQYQGVFFIWGSLYGISPMGEWEGDDMTLYPPAGGTVLASAAPISSNYDNIPRISDIDYYSAAGKDQRAWSLLYWMIANSTTGIGDICKHLTDWGRAPSYFQRVWGSF